MAQIEHLTLAGRPALDAYFQTLETIFAEARVRVPSADERAVAFADHQLRFRFAGAELAKVMLPALAHLPSARFAQGLDIVCWDGATTGEVLPPPPWPWPAEWPASGFISPYNDPLVRVAMFPEIDATLLACFATGRAVFWVKDARRLPTHHYGAPLLILFSWWLRFRNLSLLHAGCVGTERGAVLLVGRGGSGKSTTSLLCAEAGMNYLSDDYCVGQADPAPVVHSLYSSGKLHRAHLARFPDLAALAVDPFSEPQAKPVIFLGQVPRFTVVPRLPLRAILVPRITGRPETSVEPASQALALRALAPSTLMQLPGAGPDAFQSLARLARRLPCFQLNLGTRTADIPSAVRSLINQLA